MRRQFDVVGGDRPCSRVIAARNPDECEACGCHYGQPDSIACEEEGDVQPRGLLRYRMCHPWKNQAAAEIQSEKEKKSEPQKRCEGLAEPIRCRAAPLRLRQIE